MKRNRLVFGFHLSKSDIGHCVHDNKNILSLESKLIPLEFANHNKLNSANIRAKQTLYSHRTRENWFKEYWQKKLKLNIENIQESKDIPVILRIKLLKGIKLTEEQIFHAIWNLMQHRGYDRQLPWGRNKKVDIKKINEYESLAKSISAKYPCQVEAYNMGLWEYNEIIEEKLYAQANRARGYTIPREYVVSEAKELLEQASLQYPVIKDHIEIILFGQSKKPYASYTDHEYKSLRGTSKELEGIFSQRVPRIDNRYINRCTVFSEYHVCKNSQKIALEYSVLKKLYKFKYNDQKLNIKEIRRIFNFLIKEKGWQEKENLSMKKLKEALKLYAPHCIDNDLRKDNINIITKLKPTGRSIFCKKALYIIKSLLLLPIDENKINPEIIAERTNTSPDQVEQVLKKIRFNRQNVFSLRKRDLLDEIKLEYNELEQNEIIKKIINLVNDYVLKNRLQIYLSELSKLKNKYHEPEYILLDLAGNEKQKSDTVNNDETKLFNFVNKIEKFDSLESKQLNIFEVIDSINNITTTIEDNLLKIDKKYCFNKIEYLEKVLRLITAILFGWSKETVNKKLCFSNNKELANLREKHELDKLLLPVSEKILQEELEKIPQEERLSKTNTEINKLRQKTRDSKRKSALDAFSVSILKNYDEELKLLLRSFVYKIKLVLPEKIKPNVKKLQLENTIYGYRKKYNKLLNTEEHYIVKKINLQKKQKSKLIIRCDEKYIERKIWDQAIKEDWLKDIQLGNVQEKTWESYLQKYQHPVWKCPVKKVLIIESQSKEAPYYTHDNRMIIGQYINIAKNPKKDKDIQLKRSTEYKGHLLCIDKNKKYFARPVFVFESIDRVKQKLRAQKIELYSEDLFNTGCFIEIKTGFLLQGQEIEEPAGIYILQTIRNSKQFTLESPDSKNISVSLDKLLKAGIEKVNNIID